MRPCPAADERTITDCASWLAKKATRTYSEGLGVPRSTAASWLRRGPRAVVTLDVVTKDAIELQAEVIQLHQRNEVLSAIVRPLFMLLRLAGVRLDETRIPDGAAKAKILAAIVRARTTLQLAVVLQLQTKCTSRSRPRIQQAQ